MVAGVSGESCLQEMYLFGGIWHRSVIIDALLVVLLLWYISLAVVAFRWYWSVALADYFLLSIWDLVSVGWFSFISKYTCSRH